VLHHGKKRDDSGMRKIDLLKQIARLDQDLAMAKRNINEVWGEQSEIAWRKIPQQFILRASVPLIGLYRCLPVRVGPPSSIVAIPPSEVVSGLKT
jgi:hypothetical protein